MPKFVEYFSRSGKKLIEHGAVHKQRLEYLVADDCELTVKPITDEQYAVLIGKFGGTSVDPSPE